MSAVGGCAPHTPIPEPERCAPLSPPTRPRNSFCGGSAPTPPRAAFWMGLQSQYDLETVEDRRAEAVGAAVAV